MTTACEMTAEQHAQQAANAITGAIARVHIVGAGGNAGILAARCLSANDAFYVTGWDDNPWGQRLQECPLTNDTNADLVLPVPDSLVRLWAGRPNTFLPDAGTIERCQEKHLTAKLLGDLAPYTIWVRDTHGAGGAGAAKLTGRMAAEYLPGRNLSCEVVYYEGELRGWFQKERLSYSINSANPHVMGVGRSLVSRCISDSNLVDLTATVVTRLMDRPHGIFGVDFREDQHGIPRVTEINPGRFLTASYIYYYRAGYNLLQLACELGLGIDPTPLGDYPEGVAIISQYDKEPWVGRLPDTKVETHHGTL